jgi:GNAT superfamily N-acetyltransferase
LSDYVWQLELRREVGQVIAMFREVRLPRSIAVKYPRDPSSLVDEWMRRDVVLVALHEGIPIGYLCAIAEHASAVAWVTDLAVSPTQRRKGAASALLTAAQEWAPNKDAVCEMQSNQAASRLCGIWIRICGHKTSKHVNAGCGFVLWRPKNHRPRALRGISFGRSVCLTVG